MGNYTKLTPRPLDGWDKGDHLAFALAGLSAVTGRALHETLLPESRGWVGDYPEKLADDLQHWVDMVRAQDVGMDGPPDKSFENADGMSRQQALNLVAAHVDAGEWPGATLVKKCFSDDATLVLAWNAFNGKLGAAKAFYQLVLPGAKQYSIETDPTCLRVRVTCWPDGLSGDRNLFAEAWSVDDDARAWFVATLKILVQIENSEK